MLATTLTLTSLQRQCCKTDSQVRPLGLFRRKETLGVETMALPNPLMDQHGIRMRQSTVVICDAQGEEYQMNCFQARCQKWAECWPTVPQTFVEHNTAGSIQ